jgi:hypothetical protein
MIMRARADYSRFALTLRAIAIAAAMASNRACAIN